MGDEVGDLIKKKCPEATSVFASNFSFWDLPPLFFCIGYSLPLKRMAYRLGAYYRVGMGVVVVIVSSLKCLMILLLPDTAASMLDQDGAHVYLQTAAAIFWFKSLKSCSVSAQMAESAK